MKKLLLILLMLCLIPLVSSQLFNPIRHWSFDNNTIESIYGIDNLSIDLGAGSVYNVTGINGSALSLSMAYLSATNNKSLSLPYENSWSINFWAVNISNSTSETTGGATAFYSKFDNSGGEGSWMTFYVSRRQYGILLDSVSTFSTAGNYACNENTWCMYTIVHHSNKTKIELYQNGNLFENLTVASGVFESLAQTLTNTANLVINFDQKNSQRGNMTIDEYSIYDKALTTSQISFLNNLYATPSGKLFGTQYVYDEIDDSIINSTLWTMIATLSGTVEENNDYIDAIAGGSDSAYAKYGTLNLPQLDYIQNITFRTRLSCTGGTGYSKLDVFGNTLKTLNCPDGTNDTLWTLERKGNNYTVYADNSTINQIVPSTNTINMSVLNTVSGTTASARIYYVHYNSREGFDYTINNPQNNTQYIRGENVTFNISLQMFINQLSSVSLYLNNQLNQTFTTTSQAINTTFTEKLYDVSSFKFLFCDNGTNCAYSDTYNLNQEVWIENSIIYNQSVGLGSTQSYILNMTYDNSSYSSYNVFLTYNNTNYSTSFSQLGTDQIFISTIDIPTVITQTNKSFYFDISLTNSSGTFYYQSSINNQTINVFYIDDCTTYNNNIFNFSMYDEQNLSEMSGTIETTFKLYSLKNNNLISIYNKSYSYTVGGSAGICFDSLNETYRLEYSIRHYGDSNYYKKFRISQNTTLTNTTTNQMIKLYNLLTSSGKEFKVIVTGSLYTIGNSNLLVNAQKQYLGLNEFKLVESTLTDTTGEGALHLIQTDDIYNFIVSYNGLILGTFDNYQVRCQNELYSQCTITLNLAGLDTGTVTDFKNYQNVSISYNLDRVNNILYMYYSSTDGEIKTINETIKQLTSSGNNTICALQTTGSSGTLVCNIPIYYQNTTFFSEVRVNNVYASTTFFSLGEDFADLDTYGVEIILSLFLFSCIVMLMLAHPIMIVIGGVLGITISTVLLFVTGGSWIAILSAITFYVVAGVVIIIILSKKS